MSTSTLTGGQVDPSGLPIPVIGTTASDTQIATPASTTIYTVTCNGLQPPPPGDPNYVVRTTVSHYVYYQ